MFGNIFLLKKYRMKPNGYCLMKWSHCSEFIYLMWLFTFPFPANVLGKGISSFLLPPVMSKWLDRLGSLALVN